MNIRIEEAFHDCFERMLSGESLESCLSRYPQYAAELDSMLRTSYDIKRKAYPIQPRPEFKYWARVRMQNVQQYGAQPGAEEKHVSSNLRRNLAISLAALLVFTIASSGTAAASSDAMPDEPLYGVKLAVEQARVTLAPSDTDKAEVYAQLTEKRAQEIAVMAAKGNDEKVIATTKILNDQLQKLEENMAKFEAEYEADLAKNANSATGAATATPFTTIVPPAPNAPGSVTPSVNGAIGLPPAVPGTTIVPPAATTNGTRKFTLPTTGSSNQTMAAGDHDNQNAQRTFKINKAREIINSSTAKSLTILQGALDKAPAVEKSNLTNAITQTLTTNKRIQLENNRNSGFIKKGPQNTNSDNSTDQDDDDSTIKPDVKGKTFVNPSDKLQNRNNFNNDSRGNK